MNFALSDAHLKMRAKVRDFAGSEVQPTAAQRDAEERFDRRLFERMGAAGLTGIPWPVEYGGAGADYIAYVIAVEELSRVCASTGVMLSVHTSLAGWCLYTYGTEAQKRKYLRPLSEGLKLGAYCLTESGSGSDAAAMKTRAEKAGEGYRLNGSKIFVTNAGEADVYLVFAMTDFAKKRDGCSAFIVEKGAPGLRFGKKEKKLGIRSSPTMEVIFDECLVTEQNLLGEEGQGFHIAMKALDGGRSGIAAQALGIAQAALDAVVDHGHDHRQKLADMAVQIEAARLLTYQSAWREGQGMPYRKESAVAKLFASDTAVRAALEAVQILGEQGCTDAYPVERYLRDAKVTQIYEGTNEIQRLVISRMLLAD